MNFKLKEISLSNFGSSSNTFVITKTITKLRKNILIQETDLHKEGYNC